MKRLAALLGLVVLLASCGDSTEPEPPTVTGVWTGSIGTVGVRLTLNETNGNVTGSGYFTGSTTLAMTAAGNHVHPNVSITLTTPGYQPINIDGQLDDDRIIGQANGSGYNNTTIVLDR